MSPSISFLLSSSCSVRTVVFAAATVGATTTAAMSSESLPASWATLSMRLRALASSPSPTSSSSRRSRPSITPSTRASISPSVKSAAVEPGTSCTVVWRRPVLMPTPIGGEDPVVTGSCGWGPITIGAGWPAVA